MSDPIVEPADLGTYLNDDSINEDRALVLISDAQTLCESVVSPLPAGAAVVVKRVAKRAYMDQGRQMPSVVPGIGSQASSHAPTMGDVWLSRTDIADLRRMAGGGGAFTIDLLPTGYVAPVTCYPLGDWDQVP